MNHALTTWDDPELKRLGRGKVRESFEMDGALLMITTDRISAFDCVLPDGIPDKGRVLNQLTLFWMDKFADLVPNHLIETDIARMPAPVPAHPELAGRTVLARKAAMFPVECVVRGYLVGSGWKDYQKTGSVCGIALPQGLRQADELKEPVFTPAAKNNVGHDENISFDRMVEMVGGAAAEELRRLTIEIYTRARSFARGKGILIADTKMEFGMFDGKIILCDEVLTPDSSRFWPADSYAVGTSPPSFDKQFVRDYLETLDWDKTPPAPALPAEVIERTRAKYVEACTRLTDEPFPW